MPLMGQKGKWSDEATKSFKADTLAVVHTGLPRLNIEEPVICHVDGTEIHFLTSRVPLFDEQGHVIGVVGISLDITEKKKTEQLLIREKERAEMAARAKSDFISSVSHEFCTPMNAMMGMTQLLLLKVSDDDAKLKLNEIMRAGEHLMSLITEILDFSKLESEKFDLHEQPVSLKNIFDHTTKQLSSLLERQAKDVALTLNYAANLPDYIIGDEKCLRQLIFNLGGNAIKFTEQGSIKINALLLNKTEDSVQIRFEFQDTGKGIVAEKLGTIFDRFSQVDSSYSRQYGGVGLGLAITKKLIDRMKGLIGVESVEGAGSLFWCEVDFKLANSQQIAAIESDNQPIADKQIPPYTHPDYEVPALLHKHVLVIEDDPNQLNKWVINEMLETLGGRAVNFKDAASVLVYLNQNTLPVDLILTDIGLPDMDGVTLMKKIRADERYCTCPIIAVTGFSSEREINLFLASGANKVVNKPISLEKLKSSIKHYF